MDPFAIDQIGLADAYTWRAANPGQSDFFGIPLRHTLLSKFLLNQIAYLFQYCQIHRILYLQNYFSALKAGEGQNVDHAGGIDLFTVFDDPNLFLCSFGEFRDFRGRSGVQP
jgi:hypothetical protein